MRLTAPGKSAPRKALQTPLILDPLPQPPLFVGRRPEQRELRQALPNLRVNMAYVWGMSGIGKSALVGRVLQRQGRKGIVDSVLVISCHQTPPQEILGRIATWLEPQFPLAAQSLRNPQLSPDDRIKAAAEQVRKRRLILIFDRFEAYLKESADRHHYEVPNMLLEGLFRALATAPWSVLTVFTSRYRWLYLTKLNGANHVEIHLNALLPHEVGMMLQRLPNLNELGREYLNDLLGKTGGHPATVLQLEAQAAKDRPQMIADLPRLPRMLAKWWHTQFLGEVFAQMSQEERSTLMGLSVLEGPFWAGYVQIAAGVPTRQAAEAMMARWEAFSLVHFLGADEDDDTAWYRVHEMIRTYMLQSCTSDQIRDLHRRSARVIESDLAAMAVHRYQHVGGPKPDPNNPYKTARAELRFIMERGTGDFGARVIGRVLDWRKHFLTTGDYARAADIVNDTWNAIAFRYGEPQLARTLLEETIETADDEYKAIARANMADFLIGDGKLDDAMKVYETSIHEFTKLKDDTTVAVITGKQAALYNRMGKTDKAIKAAGQAWQLFKQVNDTSGEIQSLRQISAFYSVKGKYQDALKYAIVAEEMLRQHEDWHELMLLQHSMAIIYKNLNQYNHAMQCNQNALSIAEQFGELSQIGSSLSEISSLLMNSRQLSDAARCMLEAISIAERINDQSALALRLFRMGVIYEMQRNFPEAKAMCERALSLAKTHNPSLVKDITEAIKRQRGR
jgi:tetratricopeptide (TPR) repeat protein